MRSQVEDAGNERWQLEEALDRAMHCSDVSKIELAHAMADLSRADAYLDRFGSNFAATRFEAERLKLVVRDLSQAAQNASAEMVQLNAIIDARNDTIAAMSRDLEQRKFELADTRRQMEALQASDRVLPAVVAPTRANGAQSAALQRRLRDAEEDAALQRALVALMQGMLQVLASPGRWWTRLLPGFWVRRWKYDRLRRKGLFDAKFYKKRYPDVVRAGIDPLHHYVSHGLEEGRVRT